MFYILVNSICTTSRSFAFLALLLQVATGWKGTQPSRWPELTKERSLPNNTIPSKEGISGNLTYFSHELVGHWSFYRRLWVTAFASLVFFSLNKFLVIVLSLSPSFLAFLLHPAHWGFVGAMSEELHGAQLPIRVIPHAHSPFPQQCWCAQYAFEK